MIESNYTTMCLPKRGDRVTIITPEHKRIVGRTGKIILRIGNKYRVRILIAKNLYIFATLRYTSIYKISL